MPKRPNRQNLFFIGSFSTQNYGDLALRDMLQRYSQLKGLDSFFLGFSFSKWQLIRVIYAMRKSACVVLGPGSLFQCKTSIRQNFYYLTLVILAKILGKKVIALGLGIDSMPAFVKACVKKVLCFCNRLYLRDAYSYNIFSKSKAAVTVKQIPDLLFHQPEKMLSSAQGSPAICWVPALSKNNEFLTVKSFVDKESFSMLVADPSEQAEVQKYFDMPVAIFSTEYLKTHQPCYLISFRFHVALKAIMLGIPVILPNNQQKCIELAKDFNLPVVDFSDPDALIFAIKTVKQFGNADKVLWVKKLAQYQQDLVDILEENYECFFKKL